MNLVKYLLLYLKSGLNLALVLISALLIILSFLFLPGLLQTAIPLAVLGAYLTASAAILVSRRGAREIAGEQQEQRDRETAAKIARDTALRENLARLRLPDEGLRRAIEYFLLVSGTYLEKCRELAIYSPAGSAKIEEVVQLCQVYLEERDQSSTEKRYNLPDTDGFADYKSRVINLIQAAAGSLKQLITDELTGLTGSEQIEIIEELKP